jgi:hypothetical protein
MFSLQLVWLVDVVVVAVAHVAAVVDVRAIWEVPVVAPLVVLAKAAEAAVKFFSKFI